MAEEILSESREKKRVQTLCRLAPSFHATARCLRLKNGKDFMVISTGNELVYIIEGGKIQHVINVYSPVIEVLDYHDAQENIWIITEDGKLWAIPVPSSNEYKRSDGSLGASEELGTKATDPNVEIFAELLGNDGSLGHTSIAHAPSFMTSSSPIIQCSKEDIIHWEPGLQSFAIGCDHVVACCTTDDGARISIYPKTNSSQDGSDDHFCISSNLLYRTVLTTDVDSCLGNHKDVTVLLYLEPGDRTLVSTIDQRLFHTLFKTQLGSNLPVVIVGRQSGWVGYITVGVKNHDTHVLPQVLYHLEQPVVGVFTACLRHGSKNNTSDSDSKTISNTLVLVGALGKLVLITQPDSEGLRTSSVQFREYHLPGPIVCCAVNHAHGVLFYSTLKEVYAVQLDRYVQGPEDWEPNPFSLDLLPSSLSPVSHTIPKVSALAVQQPSTEDKMDSLLCVKTDGRVLLVEKLLTHQDEITGTAVHALNDVGVGTSGKRIKHYLGDIHEKTVTVCNLRHQIQELDDVIKQLNIATHILCDVLRKRDEQREHSSMHVSECLSKSSGIVFSVHVDYEAQGGYSKPCVILQCDLETSTKFTITHAWSMVVQVHTKQPWFNKNCVASQILNHSVALDSSSSHHISIRLEPSLSFLSPIEVSCYICFDMKEILAAVLQESDLGLTEERFAVLVRKCELNILSFLRNTSDTAPVPVKGQESGVHQIDVLQQTLNNLNTRSQPFLCDQMLQTSEYAQLSIHISKEAVVFIQRAVLKHCSLGNLAKPDSEEESILQFLLIDSRKYLCFDDAAVHGNYVVTRTPNEKKVKFQVVRAVQGSSSTMSDGFEVRVHASSEALRCSVHSSLLTVLQPVLQRNPEDSAGVPIGQLHKRLNKLKEIQTSLDLLHDTFHSGEVDAEQDESYQNKYDKLINIYKELRKLPTIVP